MIAEDKRPDKDWATVERVAGADDEMRLLHTWPLHSKQAFSPMRLAPLQPLETPTWNPGSPVSSSEASRPPSPQHRVLRIEHPSVCKHHRWSHYLPIVSWLQKYRLNFLFGDVLGGLTVAIMVVPQGMSYAVLAGLPPEYGLFCAVAGPVAYAVFGSSRHLSIGPVALVSLNMLRVYQALGVDPDSGSREAVDARIGAAVMVSLATGALLVLLGVFRLGFVVRYIPHSVMAGFTNAAAISIGISQLKNILDLRHVPGFEYTIQSCIYVLRHLQEGRPAAVGMGIGCIAVLIYLKKLKGVLGKSSQRRVRIAARLGYPVSTLLLVVFAAVITRSLRENGVNISIVGTVQKGLPAFTAPRLTSLRPVLEQSLTLVVVAFMEAYAISRKYALSVGYPLHVNQELVALGVANLVGSFFRSYPISGSFSRTAVNFEAGSRTQLAALVSVSIILLVLKYLMTTFYYIPQACLGAIIEVALLNLIDLGGMFGLYRKSKADFALAAITFIVTLLTDTQWGLVAGLGLALLLLPWRREARALAFRYFAGTKVMTTQPCVVACIDLDKLQRRPAWLRTVLPDYLSWLVRGAGRHHRGLNGSTGGGLYASMGGGNAADVLLCLHVSGTAASTAAGAIGAIEGQDDLRMSLLGTVMQCARDVGIRDHFVVLQGSGLRLVPRHLLSHAQYRASEKLREATLNELVGYWVAADVAVEEGSSSDGWASKGEQDKDWRQYENGESERAYLCVPPDEQE